MHGFEVPIRVWEGGDYMYNIVKDTMTGGEDILSELSCRVRGIP